MPRVGHDRYQCTACGETKPLTDEHFYFSRRGYVTGWCRPCQKAYLRTKSWAQLSPQQKEKRKAWMRTWYRAKNGVDPDRYIAKYQHEGVA